MAYGVIILCQLYMPLYFLKTFTEYPYEKVRETRMQYRLLQPLLYIALSNICFQYSRKINYHPYNQLFTAVYLTIIRVNIYG